MSVWASYDGFFKGIFGDEERTQKKGDQEDGDLQRELVDEGVPINHASNEKRHGRQKCPDVV